MECQQLTDFSSRRLDNKFNIFEGMLRNQWFIGIQFIIIAGQVLIIFVGGAAFSVERLNGAQWGVSIVLGLLSLPVGVVIRLFPDKFARKLVPTFLTRLTRKKGPQVLISDEDRRYEWNPALEEIRDQLTFLNTIRGGRLTQLKHKLQHPEELLPRSRNGSSRSRESSAPGTPVVEPSENNRLSPPPATPDSRKHSRTRSRSNSVFGPATAMAGIVAGSIAGWSPIERSNEDTNSAEFPSDTPHGGLDRQQGIELHPETADDDRVVADYTESAKTPPSQNPDLIPSFDHVAFDREPSTHERRSWSPRLSRSSHSQS